MYDSIFDKFREYRETQPYKSTYTYLSFPHGKTPELLHGEICIPVMQKELGGSLCGTILDLPENGQVMMYYNPEGRKKGYPRRFFLEEIKEDICGSFFVFTWRNRPDDVPALPSELNAMIQFFERLES